VSLIPKKAEVNSIAKMDFFRLLRPNECIKQPTESMDRIIYEVQLENGSFRIVSFEDISNLVGDGKSTQGDTNCLSDFGSTLWLKFGWGAKKRILHFQKMFSLQIFSVGEDSIVLNHGSHWQYQGKIVGIDLENVTAMIKWETTRKTESVDIKDLKKYSISDKSPRERKPTEFSSTTRCKNFIIYAIR
jgi:hypothetical protein